ncbi:MAG: hypothetical protein XD78_1181 [Desulfotomaculum sp. 46_296]|nr:MAG: hypothetical protein XD78_1181 [Desulfotomaculum sp. 46_296]KUK84706.1 MAG: hypothetical protein XE00_0584 [Desulfofundulus kuznetsovii]HAU30746.1 hypothetical protein [Desulfotomaculum sp.]
MPQIIQPDNPFTLFLILILLILATMPEVETHLMFLKSMLEAAQFSVRTFQTGMGSLYNLIQLAAK